MQLAIVGAVLGYILFCWVYDTYDCDKPVKVLVHGVRLLSIPALVVFFWLPMAPTEAQVLEHYPIQSMGTINEVGDVKAYLRILTDANGQAVEFQVNRGSEDQPNIWTIADDDLIIEYTMGQPTLTQQYSRPKYRWTNFDQDSSRQLNILRVRPGSVVYLQIPQQDSRAQA
jgi:hypothetical protein